MDKLELLIHNLTQAEKRYFKVYTNSKECISLFDCINKGKYSSDKKKFSAKTKNYLLNSLLSSLSSFHENISISRELDNIIHLADILYSKGLFKMVQQQLKKGVSLAKKVSSYEHLIKLYRLKKRNDIRLDCFDFDEYEMNLNELENSTNSIKDEIYLEKLQEIYRSSLLKGIKPTDVIRPKKIELKHSLKSTLMYYQVVCEIYGQQNKVKESKETYEKIQELYENNLHLLRDSYVDIFSIHSYITHCHNYLQFLKKHGFKKEYFFQYLTARSIKTKSKSLNARNNINLLISLSDFYLQEKNYIKGYDFIKENEGLIKKCEGESERIELLYINLSLLCFHNKKYRDAHKWILPLALSNNLRYSVFEKLCYFIFVVIQIELMKLDYTHRYLIDLEKKMLFSGKVNKIDSLTIQCLLAITNTKKSKSKKLFEEIKKELKKEQPNYFKEFDLENWLQQKVK
jgi:hypothetical protein